MITKTAIVLAVLIGTASTVLAAPKSHSNNPAYDVYTTSGKYVGSDPDPTIRSSLARDHGY
jgi:Mn2+/Fe2+ NRAMP family transporter